MVLLKRGCLKDHRLTAKCLATFHNLHNTFLSNFSKSRHKREKNNFTNTLALPSCSVVIASRATAHTEKSGCWIDSKYYSVLSCIPLPKRQECTVSLNYRKDFKMVWISNLDNPKVILFLLVMNKLCHWKSISTQMIQNQFSV